MLKIQYKLLRRVNVICLGRDTLVNNVFLKKKETHSSMVVFSLMIFVLKELTAICSLHLSKGRFIQTAFDYAAWEVHCFNILAINVQKEEKTL